jgi:hypothetical protein
MSMDVECTHCRVVMTSWSAAGSPIRYYQCPFCARTHSSLYGEVFRRRAGARVIEHAARGLASSSIPMPSQEDVRWARVRATASRWFARLEAETERNGTVERPELRHGAEARRAGRGDVREADPSEIVEIAPAATARRRR